MDRIKKTKTRFPNMDKTEATVYRGLALVLAVEVVVLVAMGRSLIKENERLTKDVKLMAKVAQSFIVNCDDHPDVIQKVYDATAFDMITRNI